MTQPNPDNSPIQPMLNLEDLSIVLRRSARTIRQWRADGYLPKPDLSHGKTVLWRAETIDNWLDEQSRKAS